MSDLTVISKSPTIQLLPAGLKPFALVRVGLPTYKSLSPIDKTKYCLEVITKAHASVGDKGEDADLLTFQTMELEACLKDKYGELTIQEISKALEMLIAGEFGQHYGLNRKAYYQALKAYYEHPERTQSFKHYLQLMDAQTKTEPTPAEKREKNKQAVIWYFKEYKKNGKLGSGSFAIYDTLWDFGFLKFSAEEKKDIRQKVEAEYTTELELSRKKQRISANQLAELLLTFDTNPTLKGNLRKEALKRFFDKLIKEGIELETIIE